MKLITLILVLSSFSAQLVWAQDGFERSIEARRRVEADQNAAAQITSGQEQLNYGDLVADESTYEMLSSAAGAGWNALTRQACGDNAPETVAAINDCNETYTNQSFNNPAFLENAHNLEEELIYLTAAERTHQFAQCQRQLFDGLPATEFQNSAWEQFRAIQNAVRGQNRALTRAEIDNAQTATMMSGSSQDAIIAMGNLNTTDRRISQANQNIAGFISRIPLGNRAEVKDALLPLFSRPNVTRAEVMAAYNGAINTLNENNRLTMCYFQGGQGCPRERVGPNGTVSIPARGVSRTSANGTTVYLVDQGLKQALRDSGQIENVVRSLGGMPDRLKDAFMCRQAQRYTVGPIVLEVAQIPFYFAGTYGLSRLALRMGSAAVRASSITGRIGAQTARLSARLGTLGLEASDFALVAESVRQSCQSVQIDVGAYTGACSLETELAVSRGESRMAQCLTDAALGIGGGAAAVAGDIVATGRRIDTPSLRVREERPPEPRRETRRDRERRERRERTEDRSIVVNDATPTPRTERTTPRTDDELNRVDDLSESEVRALQLETDQLKSQLDTVVGRDLPGNGTNTDAYNSIITGDLDDLAYQVRKLREQGITISDEALARARSLEGPDRLYALFNRTPSPELLRTYRRLVDDRRRLTRHRVDQNRRDLSQEADLTDVDCGTLNRAYPGAFMPEAGCRQVRFNRESQGNYCTCNDRLGNRSPGPWFLPCAGNLMDYRTPSGILDQSALPSKTIRRCWKVDLPEGLTCFQGGLGPKFSGYGGASQILCEGPWMNEGTRRADLAAGNPPITLPEVDPARTWRVTRVTFVSERRELREIADMGRICQDRGLQVVGSRRTCSGPEIEEIRRRFNAISDRVRLSPEEINDFNQYVDFLAGRRSILPNGELSSTFAP